MAVLVIVFAWLPYSWNKIAITILGVLLAIMALIGTCCCSAMIQGKAKDTETVDAKE
jgi:hypothetical protein